MTPRHRSSTWSAPRTSRSWLWTQGTWGSSSGGRRRAPRFRRSSTSSVAGANRCPRRRQHRRGPEMTDPAATGGAATEVVELRPEHGEALLRFFRALPESDRTFIKEDVTDPETVRSWSGDDEGGGRWIALQRDGDGTEVLGYVAVRRLPGWSDHVGEVRLVVSPAGRGTGLGRRLARHALAQAVEAGLAKVVVEVVAEQGAALSLFTDLGFTGEALLEDHIRDRTGELRDLLVLAHHVGRTWSGMDTVGLPEALGQEAG